MSFVFSINLFTVISLLFSSFFLIHFYQLRGSVSVNIQSNLCCFFTADFFHKYFYIKSFSHLSESVKVHNRLDIQPKYIFTIKSFSYIFSLVLTVYSDPACLLRKGRRSFIFSAAPPPPSPFFSPNTNLRH